MPDPLFIALILCIAVPWAIMATMPLVLLQMQVKTVLGAAQAIIDARANYAAAKADAEQRRRPSNAPSPESK